MRCENGIVPADSIALGEEPLPRSTDHVRRKQHRSKTHLGPMLGAACAGSGAIVLVVYLLWPTWHAVAFGGAKQLPITVGGVIFNVPSDAIRMRLQRRSGPQDRIDLAFNFPALTPPEKPKHITAETIEEMPIVIDRILLSIAVRGDELSPEERLQTIYPRYLDAQPTMQDGLAIRAFAESSPYRNEDLVSAETPAFAARCTRDGLTPGICLSQRRLDGVDMTFRFPRAWLSEWRDVAAAMDRLISQLRAHRTS